MATLETFTKLGGELFAWPRLRACSGLTRYLWIVLYASPRRAIQGLWHAGLPTIADIAKLTPDDTLSSLDQLLDHELIEFDRTREVLRLTELPDRMERPQNGKHILSMWTRFRSVPECQVKNAHVRLLEWLMDEPTADHASAWSKTFATVAIPPPRRRGVRHLLDSDTATAHQPSLFTKPSENVRPTTDGDTVCHTVSDTVQSMIYDLRSLSTSGEEMQFQSGSEASAQSNAIALQELAPVPLMSLVPLGGDLAGLPFDAPTMLANIAAESAGRFADSPLDGRLLDALYATIRSCAEQQVGLADLRVVGKWLASGGLAFRSDLGPVWIAKPGNLLDAVGQSRAWVARGSPSIGTVDRRAEPAPSSAFGRGRRQI